MIYRRLLRPLLFRMSPEAAHRLAVTSLRLFDLAPLAWAGERLFRVEDAGLAVETMGLRFENPVGLAAGFDKDATLLAALRPLGFGFGEVGSVTARPHAGNLGTRLARLPERGALWNRLGLPSAGCEAVAARLAAARAGVPVGVNVAPTPGIPEAARLEDLLRSLVVAGRLGDYVTVNLSCPNLGMDPRAVARELLGDVEVALGRFAAEVPGAPPVLLKLPPTLEGAALGALVQRAEKLGVAGYVLVNTLPEALAGAGRGGVSGLPLRALARARVREVRALAPEATVIGVGGVSDAASARALLDDGADLVQLYTGLVFEGPGVVRRILEGLVAAGGAPSRDQVRAP